MITLLNQIQKNLIKLVIFLVPLFFIPLTQEFFVTGKFYLLSALLLILLIISAVRLIFERKITIVRSPFDKSLILIGVAAALSVLLSSINKFQAIIAFPLGLAPLFVLIGLFYFFNNFEESTKSKKELFDLLKISTAIAAVISILFFFEPLKNAQLPASISFLSLRSFSAIGNHIDTLVFFGFFLLGSIAFVVSSKKTNVFLNSITSLIILVSVILVGYSVIKPQQDLANKIQLPPFSTSWYAAVETLKKPMTAVFGFGIDNFSAVFSRVKTPDYNNAPYWQLNFTQSRSALLHLWTETGIFGLAVFLLLCVYIIRELHSLHQHKDNNYIPLLLLSIYMGVIFIALPPSFLNWFLLMILLAMVSSTGRTYEKSSMKIVVDLKHIAPIYIVLSVLLIATSVSSAYLLSRAFQAEYYFKKSIDAIRTNKGQDVYTHMLKAIRLNPYIERYHLQFSQLNLLLANNLAQKKDLTDQDRQAIAQFIQQAIAEGKRLVQLNPAKSAHWANLALIYRNIINIAQGAESWTVASYQRASALDPNNPVLRLNLGGVYYSLKNYESAQRSFEEAVILKRDWANAHYNLAWSLYQNEKYDQAVLTLQNVLALLPNKNSEDYKNAQKNLEEFKKKLPKVEEPSATEEGDLKLQNPQGPVLSPPLELPKESGPEEELKESAQEVEQPEVTPTPRGVSPTSITPSENTTPSVQP